MKVNNTITFIISKNYGRPLSLSANAGRVYFSLALGGFLLISMVAMSLLYLVSYNRVQQIREENHRLLKERDTLQERLMSTNHEAFEGRQSAFIAALLRPLSEASADSGSADVDEESYEPPIHIVSYTAKITNSRVEVAFRMMNKARDWKNYRGGFLLAVFENDDASPVVYAPSPVVNLNEDGFPQAYKSGVHLGRFRNATTFRRRVARPPKGEYFNNITLYLFSLRGGLLLRERFPLGESLFEGEKTVIKTFHLS